MGKRVLTVVYLSVMLILVGGFVGLLVEVGNSQKNDTCPNCNYSYKLAQYTALTSPNGPDYITYEYECENCGGCYTFEKTEK